MFELFFYRPATRFLETLEGAELQEVRRLLDIIAMDPFWDNRTKFPFPVPPPIVSIYESGQFRIVYHVITNTRINIWAIGHSGEPLQLN